MYVYKVLPHLSLQVASIDGLPLGDEGCEGIYDWTLVDTQPSDITITLCVRQPLTDTLQW